MNIEAAADLKRELELRLHNARLVRVSVEVGRRAVELPHRDVCAHSCRGTDGDASGSGG